MLLALFATIILLVPLRWLKSKGCPSILALIIVLSCVAIVFWGMTRLVVRSVADMREDVPVYYVKIERELHRLEEVLETYGINVDLGAKKKQKSQEDTDQTPPGDDVVDIPNNDLGGTTIPAVIENQQQISPPIVPLPSPNIEADTSAEEGGTDESITGQDGKTFWDRFGNVISILTPPSDDEEDILPDPAVLPMISQPPSTVEPSMIDLSAQSLMAWFTMVLNEIQRLVITAFLVMIITLFMIFETSRFPAKIDRAFGKGPITNEHLHKIATEIRRYLFLKAFSSLLSGIAATIIYWCFGVQGFLFWGMVACFLYFIPNIGGIVASIVPGLLIFMNGGLPVLLLYIVVLTAAECMLAYGVEPKILGHGLGISTVVIILSLIIWGWLLGIIGLFLAAPLTIMVKIILQAFKETEWVAILIGDGSKRSL
jgi:predicted PurR-regulated permease PerM